MTHEERVASQEINALWEKLDEKQQERLVGFAAGMHYEAQRKAQPQPDAETRPGA